MAAARAAAPDDGVDPMASDGGCRDTSRGDWTIGSCISGNGGWLWPDFYVNNAPWNTDGYRCQMQVINAWGDPVSNSSWPCTVGHHGPDRVGVRAGQKYYNRITVWFFFDFIMEAWSPVITA